MTGAETLKVRTTLVNEMKQELTEVFKPEPMGSREFHAGRSHGLKQVLELFDSNKGLEEVLQALKSDATKEGNEALKQDASSRDFHAGLCSALNRAISLLDPNKKPNALYEL